MNIVTWFKSKLPADPEAVDAYRTVLPHNIHVSIKKEHDNLIAVMDGFGDEDLRGLWVTEAKTLADLVRNVNDLVYTKVNMPYNIRAHYGDVFTPKGYKPNSATMELVRT